MVLTVDAGNTETVVGYFAGDDLRQVWRLATNSRSTGDELALTLTSLVGQAGLPSPIRMVVATVVPATRHAWVTAARILDLPLRFLTPTSPIPVRLEVDHPLQVGADRIANTLAAATIHSCDTIVVDAGTATTFDCITGDGVFLGGVIAPGPQTSAGQLAKAAAQLQQVDLGRPRRVMGRNTLDCLRSGVFYSVIDGVDGIVDRLIKEWEKRPLVIATGGLADLLGGSCRTIEQVDKALTIKGISIAGEYLFEKPSA